MEVIIYSNTALNNIISKHNVDSINYCSNKTQNKFISLLGNTVQAEITAEIKQNFSLYFWLYS
jgi:hypothetical protein